MDVVHDEKDLLLLRHHIERGHDVGVADACGHPRLVEKHGDEVGVLRELRVQALDGDGAREPFGPEQPAIVHRGHPPGCDLIVDRILAEDARSPDLLRDSHHHGP